MGGGVAFLPSTTVEFRFRDLSFRMLDRLTAPPPNPRIVLIAVDQASLRDFARVGVVWPFPRVYYGLVASFVARSGARALGLDLLFTEPSPHAGDDQAFRDTLLSLSMPVVLAAFTGQEGYEVEPLFRCPPETSPPPAIATLGSLPLLQEGAAAVGNVAEIPDPDGVFRRIRNLVEDRRGRLPSFSAALWSVTTGSSPCTLPDTLLLPPLGNPSRRYPVISFSEVVRWAFEGKPIPLFRDRVVILGTTAPGLKDIRPTPYASTTPGIAVHAWALESLLLGKHLSPFQGLLARLFWMIFPVFLLLFRYPLRRTLRGTLLLESGLLLALFGLHLLFLGRFLTDVSLFRLLLAWSTSLLVFQSWLYREEGRQRAFIRKVLSLYLAPEVSRVLLENPSRLRLGGERREITVFFCDVRGFTALSEKLSPEVLVEVMNAYLDRVTEVLFQHGATLDKYLGDGVMAFWGAPIAQPDHARKACQAALEVQQVIQDFSRSLRRKGLPELRVGVGLATGPAVVGNLGSRRHFDYTAVGDTVNTASRLEGLTRLLGADILLAGPTRERAGEGFFMRRVGKIRVKGKQHPIDVWELRLTPHPDLPLWNHALQALQGGHLKEAYRIFQRLSDLDPVAAFYAEWLTEKPDEALAQKGVLTFVVK